MEEYLRSLQKQLKDFPIDEQVAIMDEIGSHADSAETDPRMGGSGEDRRSRLLKELGSPEDMGKGVKALYRPGRFIDYLLILIPFLLHPYLNSFYMNVVMPRYAGGALLLDATFHLLLALIGVWRRSAALALFWAALAISQLSIVTGRLYAYYGIQTVFWAVLLIGLLYLSGNVLWRHRNDPILVAFGLVTVGMSVMAGLLNVLAMIRPFALSIWRGGSLLAQYAANGLLDQSLLQAYINVRDVSEFYAILALALFFIPSNREIRWFGLGLAGCMLGLGHQFLLDFASEQNLMAPWIYASWAVVPLMIAVLGWWLDRNKRQQMQLPV